MRPIALNCCAALLLFASAATAKEADHQVARSCSIARWSLPHAAQQFLDPATDSEASSSGLVTGSHRRLFGRQARRRGRRLQRPCLQSSEARPEAVARGLEGQAARRARKLVVVRRERSHLRLPREVARGERGLHRQGQVVSGTRS